LTQEYIFFERLFDKVYLSSGLVPSGLSLYSKYFSFLQPPSHSCSPVKTQWSQRSVFKVFSGFSIGTWQTSIKAGGNGYSNGPLDCKVTKQEQLCLQKHKGPYFNMLS